MPGGAFPVTPSMMTNGAAVAHEDDRPYGTLDYWNAYGDGQDAAMIDPLSTPASFAPTPASYSCQTPHTLSQPRSHPDKLQIIEWSDWEPSNSYEEDVPSCMHYRIVWKVVVNNKRVSEDTEEDVVVSPVPYWHMVLRPKLEKLLMKKVPQNRPVRCDDTGVVVSVTARTEKDLVKRFDDLSINWSVIAKTLIGWGEHLRSGGSARRGIKRGSSATKTMLAERDAQVEAEEEDTGAASLWKEVYALFRCPGSPCDRGLYCWIDPVGKQHYNLRSDHLRAIIDKIKSGRIVVKGHEDVPDDIREQLYREERQRLERQPKSNSVSSPFPPINITNVLPQSQPSTTGSNEPAPVAVVRPCGNISFTIPGLRDKALEEYTEWQESTVGDENWKAAFRKAREVAVRYRLDLEQIYADQDPGLFIKEEVDYGVARRFVHDIKGWVEEHKPASDTSIIN